ncbi:hypothetical protein D9M71_606930 [compost metagenome]
MLRGQGAEHLAGVGQVLKQWFGAAQAQAQFGREPVEQRLQLAIAIAQALVDLALQARDAC